MRQGDLYAGKYGSSNIRLLLVINANTVFIVGKGGK